LVDWEWASADAVDGRGDGDCDGPDLHAAKTNPTATVSPATCATAPRSRTRSTIDLTPDHTSRLQATTAVAAKTRASAITIGVDQDR